MTYLVLPELLGRTILQGAVRMHEIVVGEPGTKLSQYARSVGRGSEPDVIAHEGLTNDSASQHPTRWPLDSAHRRSRRAHKPLFPRATSANEESEIQFSRLKRAMNTSATVTVQAAASHCARWARTAPNSSIMCRAASKSSAMYARSS